METAEHPAQPPPPTLRMRLVGGFSLSFDDRPVTTVDAPRLQSLVARLALHSDTRQPRERLAFLFWPTPRSRRPARI